MGSFYSICGRKLTGVASATVHTSEFAKAKADGHRVCSICAAKLKAKQEAKKRAPKPKGPTAKQLNRWLKEAKQDVKDFNPVWADGTPKAPHIIENLKERVSELEKSLQELEA
jgi:hypothetical protein